MNKYDIILQNNASKQNFLFTGLTDASESHLYHKFEVDIDAQEGEYTYAVVYNERDDVQYEFKTPLLDTILHYGEDESIVLRLLQPNTGLLRIGDKVEPANIYDNNSDKPIIFYEG